ncbi:MAG: sensor histidine kinase [Streptosporangiaceae bacterium]
MDLGPKFAAVRVGDGAEAPAHRRVALARRHPVVGAVATAVSATVALIVWNAFDPDQLFVPFSWLMPATFAAMGSVIVWRQPRNTVGWIVLLSGPFAAFGLASDGWAVRSFSRAGRPLPFGATAAWFANLILSSHLIFLVIGLLFLLFPDGRLPSRRWRWLLWFGAFVYGVLAVTAALWSVDVTGLFPRRTLSSLLPGQSVAAAAAKPFLAIQLVVVAACVAALIMRFRRAQGDERQQLKWFACTVTGVFAAVVLSIVVIFGNGRYSLALMSLIPVAIAVAVLKYHLYDLDLVISKAIVFATLAAFVTVIYAGTVAGVGTLVGRRGSLTLAALAAAVIAVAFQPLRERVQHLANRIVYGRRATPYEVLAEFSGRMADAYATEEVPAQLAQILAQGTGAQSAEVWLTLGPDLRQAAAWPARSAQPDVHPVVDGLPVVPGSDRTVAVLHQGELLGALAVRMPPGNPLSSAHDKLIADLAGQAGLVLRNARLIQELRASRQRLVMAQDVERRRIERNIHDGAQQQLVALAVKLRLAESLIDEDSAQAHNALRELQTEAGEAARDLRDFAHGIYPPLLADRGLGDALAAQARRSAVPVTIESAGLGRYPQEVEAAVYFCCLEALQNVAKYAAATSARLSISALNSHLEFEIADNGRGFDPTATAYGIGLQGMADRLEALGGSFEIQSGPGRGTTVAGTIPVTAPDLTD